jgi:hypothetical protein
VNNRCHRLDWVFASPAQLGRLPDLISTLGGLVIGKENRETNPAETPGQTYCMKLKYVCNLLIITEILVEATGVEPVSIRHPKDLAEHGRQR